MKYTPDGNLLVKVPIARSNIKLGSHHNAAHLQSHLISLPTSNFLFIAVSKICRRQISTSYLLQFPKYSPEMMLLGKITTKRLKVKSGSHHDDAHLHP